jgi:hypothetical protein
MHAKIIMLSSPVHPLQYSINMWITIAGHQQMLNTTKMAVMLCRAEVCFLSHLLFAVPVDGVMSCVLLVCMVDELGLPSIIMLPDSDVSSRAYDANDGTTISPTVFNRRIVAMWKPAVIVINRVNDE